MTMIGQQTMQRPVRRERPRRLRSETERRFELQNLAPGVYDMHSWPFAPDHR